jgi:hypothetical protein
MRGTLCHEVLIMRVSERAVQIWSVLSLAASNRQVLTYDILSKLTGVPRQGLGKVLEPIQSYCLLERLPPLSILVVNNSGLPGAGFVAAQDIPREQLRVFSHGWLEQAVPSPEQLAEATKRLPSNGIPPAQTDTSNEGDVPDGSAMAAALEAVASRGTLTRVDDAAQWQREVRTDRPLPGRGE